MTSTEAEGMDFEKVKTNFKLRIITSRHIPTEDTIIVYKYLFGWGKQLLKVAANSIKERNWIKGENLIQYDRKKTAHE